MDCQDIGIRKFKFAAKTQFLLYLLKIQIADFDRFKKFFFDVVWVKIIISKGIECFAYFLYDLKFRFSDN